MTGVGLEIQSAMHGFGSDLPHGSMYKMTICVWKNDGVKMIGVKDDDDLIQANDLPRTSTLHEGRPIQWCDQPGKEAAGCSLAQVG